MSRIEKNLISKLSGINKQFVTDLMSEDFIENLKSKNHEAPYHNFLLTFSLALKTLNFKQIQMVSYRTSYSVSYNNDDGKANVSLEGEILFKDRRTFISTKEFRGLPSNAGREFRSFRYDLKSDFEKLRDTYLEAVKIIDKETLLEMFNTDSGRDAIFPNGNNLNISLSSGNLLNEYLRVFEKNTYFYKHLMKDQVERKITYEHKQDSIDMVFKM